jgi:hypothetical protein
MDTVTNVTGTGMAAAAVGIEVYNQVLFLDNDVFQHRLVRHILPKIEHIHIPESKTPPKVQDLVQIQRYIELVSGHSLTTNRYIERAYSIRKRPTHNYDPMSGIQEVHVYQVEDWIQRTERTNPRALLIDWDRTLTMFEGYFGDDEGEIQGDRSQYYEDVLIFLFGGIQRLQMIRSMLQRARIAKIDLYIVTNNGGCNDPKSGFNNFIAQLFQTIPYTIICGKDFKGHKGFALANYPQFHKMLVSQAAAGGTRRKRRRCCVNRRKTYKNIKS